MKKIIFLTASFFLLFSCRSIDNETDERYNLINDILNNVAYEKQYVICHCEEQKNFSDAFRIFYSSNNDKMYRRELIHNSLEFLNQNKINWIFDKEDISFLKKTYKDSTYSNCWNKQRIKHSVEYLTCKEFEDLYSDANVKRYANGTAFPISRNSRIFYISKPFFNKSRTKTFFLFGDSKGSKDTTPAIAIAQKIKKKWTVIGLIKEGYD